VAAVISLLLHAGRPEEHVLRSYLTLWSVLMHLTRSKCRTVWAEDSSIGTRTSASSQLLNAFRARRRCEQIVPNLSQMYLMGIMNWDYVVGFSNESGTETRPSPLAIGNTTMQLGPSSLTANLGFSCHACETLVSAVHAQTLSTDKAKPTSGPSNLGWGYHIAISVDWFFSIYGHIEGQNRTAFDRYDDY
jgi:hypothetical protein